MAVATPPILIVEDSPTQAALLRYLLEGAGHRVVAARDGVEGLAAARREGPSMVISDVEMPGMDGYAMCRAIKEDAALQHMPVVLLTSLSDPADVLRGLEARADYYLTKPYDADHLLAQVRGVLAHPPGPDAGADAGPQRPIEVGFGDERRVVTAGRRQVLNLLLSTYGNAVQRNRELVRTEQQLQEQNRLLQEAVRSEQAAQAAMREAQSQLIQAEKLAGLGQMVAGVAHEINNPLAFVANNVAVLERDTGALHKVIDLYREAETALTQDPRHAELLGRIRELCEAIDLDYTLSNLRDLLDRSREGLRRIQRIVSDLRAFARLDESDLSEVDVNHGVASTLNILRTRANEHGVRLETDLGTLPPLTCYPAKINQVIMNLVANAIDASPAKETVTVRTAANGKGVRIDVVDRGAGIDPSVRDRIFDPFFTTKAVGSGTGLGLSISYGIVHEHGGSIEVDSTPGKGSRFTVHLPHRARST